MKLSIKKQLFALGIVSIFLPIWVHAQAYTPTPTPMPNTNVLDSFVAAYQAKAAMWQASLGKHAAWIFWTLATIDFAWMAIRLAIRQADFGDFVVEVIKRIFFIGFFFALLSNGPAWAQAIIDSFYQAANDASSASGGVTGITPSSLFDMAANMFLDVTQGVKAWNIVEGFCSVLCALVLCMALGVTCAFLIIALIESYIAVSAGVILLGFGGSRWTKEYAVAYLKFVVASGFKLFLTQLIITIGGAIIQDWLAQEHVNADAGTATTLRGLMMLASVSVIMAMLVGKIPGLAQAMIQGVSTSGGDELVAPARMAAGGAMAVTGVGATVAAAKAGFSTAMGGMRAIRSATTAASAGVQPTTGFGTRIGAAVTRATGNPKVGSAIGHLAQAARGDFANRNSGGNSRGTMGGRMARAIGNLDSGKSATPSTAAAVAQVTSAAATAAPKPQPTNGS